jgi:hypothetical protein
MTDLQEGAVLERQLHTKNIGSNAVQQCREVQVELLNHADLRGVRHRRGNSPAKCLHIMPSLKWVRRFVSGRWTRSMLSVVRGNSTTLWLTSSSPSRTSGRLWLLLDTITAAMCSTRSKACRASGTNSAWKAATNGGSKICNGLKAGIRRVGMFDPAGLRHGLSTRKGPQCSNAGVFF